MSAPQWTQSEMMTGRHVVTKRKNTQTGAEPVHSNYFAHEVVIVPAS